jgi:hypothetical protein
MPVRRDSRARYDRGPRERWEYSDRGVTRDRGNAFRSPVENKRIGDFKISVVVHSLRPDEASATVSGGAGLKVGLRNSGDSISD